MSTSSSEAGITGRSIRGHLELRSDVRADGTPFLSRQSFRAPVHLSKAHAESGALVVQLVNPTAGFFDGDRLDLAVTAGKGSHLVLSTPGASRVHRARSDQPAHCAQRLTVEAGAFLEWIPEPFIPQAGARYFQRTEIGLDPGGGLIFFEWITPGRTARGEIFAYESLRWELDLRVGGTLVARERFELRPDDLSLSALRERFPAAHYLTAYAAGMPADAWPGEALDGLAREGIYLGHGPLMEGVFIVRALCRDALSARRLLADLRGILHESVNRPAPRLGRLIG